MDVRNVSSLNFRGVAFPQAATVTRAAADEIPQIFGPISGLYQLFIPYKNDEVNENGILVQGGCSLVSKEQLSPALINRLIVGIRKKRMFRQRIYQRILI